ncbi:DUF7093 family protein [Haloplanus halobius]|uniref:DUF7093 family protein n=1 Tax=Haloplanus halobius TaxID=2934938 RepID=UPI0020101D9F|nr:hypothetical protein [Haloplanus sp. XH21]
MGLRCLLGHEYANREVEREREERGNEVVVTYRTVETCDRCGERRTVSENKEVRPVRTSEEESVSTGLGGGGVTPDPGDGSPDETAAADAESDTPGDATADAPSPDATADAAQSPDAVTASETDPVAAEGDAPVETDDGVDDAIILDDSDDAEPERSRGEWPDADVEDAEAAADTAETAPSADADTVDDGATVVSDDDDWPTPDGTDEGFDAEAADGTPADVDFGGGLAPESAGDAEADTAATNGAAADGQAAGKQFVAAETVERVGDDSAGETEFFCPNCEYVRTAGESSMRAGDICPECHEGYIAERER